MRDREWSSIDERQLIKLAQSGSLPAKERLLRQHSPHIESLVHRLHVHPWNVADARQAAALGLLIALKRFDADHGATLSSYAYNFMLREVLNGLYGAEHLRKFRVHVIEFDEDLHDSEASADDVHSAIEVQRFIGSLDDAERYLVKRIFYDGLTQADVARELGVNRVAVHRRLKALLTKGGSVLGEAVA